MSELGRRKLQILSWLLHNVKLRREVQRDQQRFHCRQELHLSSGIYSNKRGGGGGGRPTRLLPGAKILLVPISFFLCWVDYALEGYTFSLSKCDFSPLFPLRGHGSHKKICWTQVGFTTKQERVKKILPFVQLQSKPAVTSLRGQLYEQMTSNPAFTEKNIQKDNAFLLDSRPVQKSLVTYHTIPSL